MAKTDTFKKFEEGTLDPRGRKQRKAAEDSTEEQLRLRSAEILSNIQERRKQRDTPGANRKLVEKAQERDIFKQSTLPGFAPPSLGSGFPSSLPASSVGGGVFPLDTAGIPEASRLSSGKINPVPGGTFTNTFGAPRSGGRTHGGTDIFADRGTPVISPVGGTVGSLDPSSLGGISARVTDPQGNNFFFTHLEGLAPGLRQGQSIQPGGLLGFVGDSGNAAGTPTHLHFSINEGRTNNISSYAWLMGQ